MRLKLPGILPTCRCARQICATSTSSATSTATSTTPSIAPAGPTTSPTGKPSVDPNYGNSSSTTSMAGIIGGVVGALAALAVAAVFVIWHRRRNHSRLKGPIPYVRPGSHHSVGRPPSPSRIPSPSEVVSIAPASSRLSDHYAPLPHVSAANKIAAHGIFGEQAPSATTEELPPPYVIGISDSAAGSSAQTSTSLPNAFRAIKECKPQLMDELVLMVGDMVRRSSQMAGQKPPIYVRAMKGWYRFLLWLGLLDGHPLRRARLSLEPGSPTAFASSFFQEGNSATDI
ncbi:uncharacterized protein EV422DRAFT_327455 [Fimicolochytrium jonesii]|uniref:uncharacterized protein n=1 Tax=Fimicolochytrium jonesii TaxID=1396493 RepID=UPI0022FEC307|nr:uncharacterized protein EV422DRAFT_327455 [Fimicolochytrium jonesii]KAI8816131.1 hypothetical protein EV422DRAFT_327455 [Fimicolochytrium jonesii]